MGRSTVASGHTVRYFIQGRLTTRVAGEALTQYYNAHLPGAALVVTQRVEEEKKRREEAAALTAGSAEAPLPNATQKERQEGDWSTRDSYGEGRQQLHTHGSIVAKLRCDRKAQRMP